MEIPRYIGSALEGVSYAGKTTTLLYTKTKTGPQEIIIVPEYSNIGKLPPFERDSINSATKAVRIILDLERKRTDYVCDQLALHPDALVLWDRGPISCLAFEIAVAHSGLVGLPHTYSEMLGKEVKDGNLLVPLKYLLLQLGIEEIKTREERMIKAGHSQIIDFLRDPRVINKLQEVFLQSLVHLPKDFSMSLDTEQLDPDSVSDKTVQFARIPVASSQTINYLTLSKVVIEKCLN